MTAPTFTCDNCHRTFPKGWSDVEARAEASRAGFPDQPIDQFAVVCDDCYQQIMAMAEREGWDPTA